MTIRFGPAVSFSRGDFDFEEPWPQLPGHEQAIPLSVVRDPIENRLGIQSVPGRHQTLEIDPADHASRLRRNPRDAVRMPDVGIHLAPDVLELIQVPDGNAPVGNGDTPDFTKRVGVEEAQSLCTVAADESFWISGQTPTFAAVAQRPTRREACQIVDEPNIGSPRQFHELAVPFLQPFDKIPTIETVLLHDLAGFELNLSQGRSTVHPGALEQKSVTVDQALRVRGRIVRIGFQYAE